METNKILSTSSEKEQRLFQMFNKQVYHKQKTNLFRKLNLLFAAIVAVSISSCQSAEEPIVDQSTPQENAAYSSIYTVEKIGTAVREIEFQSAKAQKQLSLSEISLIHKEVFQLPEESPMADIDFSTVQLTTKQNDFFNKISAYASIRGTYKDFPSFLKAVKKSFEESDEKEIATNIFIFFESNKYLFNNIHLATNAITTRANLSACDVAASLSSIMIADIATMTGIGASVGGFFGIGAAWGAALVGCVGGLAYSAAFC